MGPPVVNGFERHPYIPYIPTTERYIPTTPVPIPEERIRVGTEGGLQGEIERWMFAAMMEKFEEQEEKNLRQDSEIARQREAIAEQKQTIAGQNDLIQLIARHVNLPGWLATPSPEEYQAPSTPQDSVVLITGGEMRGEERSTEVFPSVSGCSLPPIPLVAASYILFRREHQMFTISDPPMVAACGGMAGGKLASCLVLDRENQRWDENRLGSLTEQRWAGTVVELKNIGVFFLGGVHSHEPSFRSSDFLAKGSLQWQQGPRLPPGMTGQGQCALQISPTSFITVRGRNIHEFDAGYAGPTSEEGWRDSARWPTLTTSRYQGGCAKTGNKVIIAGGHSSGAYHKSTEVLDIETRTISTGGDMASPRAYFNLATVNSEGRDRLFALGGLNGKWSVATVEEWVEGSSTWKEAERLTQRRHHFAVAAVPKNMICPS